MISKHIATYTLGVIFMESSYVIAQYIGVTSLFTSRADLEKRNIDVVRLFIFCPIQVRTVTQPTAWEGTGATS